MSYLKTERHRIDENTNPLIARALSNERELQGQNLTTDLKFGGKSSFEKKSSSIFKDSFMNRDNKRSSFFKSIENFQIKQGDSDNSYTYLSPQPASQNRMTLNKPKYTLIGNAEQLQDNNEN